MMERTVKRAKRKIKKSEWSETSQNPIDFLDCDPKNLITKKLHYANGFGLFAGRKFVENEFIVNYRGVHVDNNNDDNDYVYTYDYMGTYYGIDARHPDSGCARYINDMDAHHEPNCKPIVKVFEDGQRTICFRATRDISKG